MTHIRNKLALGAVGRFGRIFGLAELVRQLLELMQPLTVLLQQAFQSIGLRAHRFFVRLDQLA
ncbi:MAG: hypothetical protein HY270_18930 [Deltaproteobacteria bacterium]|nr:hypothetical protein [Deltaproteobacteria bacterium]